MWYNMVDIDSSEVLTDHDINVLQEVSGCMLSIWSEEIEEKNRKKIYDNESLDDFMSIFTVMVDDLIHNKNIKDYISYVRGPHLTVEAPVRYRE